ERQAMLVSKDRLSVVRREERVEPPGAAQLSQVVGHPVADGGRGVLQPGEERFLALGGARGDDDGEQENTGHANPPAPPPSRPPPTHERSGPPAGRSHKPADAFAIGSHAVVGINASTTWRSTWTARSSCRRRRKQAESVSPELVDFGERQWSRG